MKSEIIMLANFDLFEDSTNGGYQIRTKTEVYSLEFEDDDKKKTFIQIATILKNNNNISYKRLLKKVKTKENSSIVMDVLQILFENGLLPYEYASEFSCSIEPDFVSVLPETSLSVISSKSFGEKVKDISKGLEFKNVAIYSYSENIDLKKITSKSDFIIAEASEWSPYHLEMLNDLALTKNIPWLYVGGIEQLNMSVGPFFWGKETGCYECLISRLKSNDPNARYLASYEERLRKSKQKGKADSTFNRDLYENILVNFTLLEVIKILDNFGLPLTWRTKVNIDYSTLEKTSHTLLKKPFCQSCKPILQYNPSPWLESITLK